MLRKETLRKVLLNAIDRIDNDNSSYSDEELSEIIDTINKATNTDNKLSKYQACSKLGISRATFDNYVREGIIPEGKKEVGFKEKFWTLKQINNVKLKNNN